MTNYEHTMLFVVALLLLPLSAEQQHTLSVRLEAAVARSRSAQAALLTLPFVDLHLSFVDA